MASKRNATTELNHDNWDHEETTEDPGIFKQANASVLKERVIKKARRRGVANAESSLGNTFAGFSGFKGSTAPAAGTGSNAPSAFDFLKAAPSNGSAKPSFGSLNNNPAANTTASSSAFGSNGAFSFGSKSSETEKSLEKPDKKEEKPSLASLFAPKAGSWKCSTCDVSNDAEKGECVACSTAKPGAKAEPSKKPLSAAPKGDKWTCGTCMVPNESSAEKCVCCENPKPGSKPEAAPEPAKTVAGFTMSAGGGFKFDGDSKTSSPAGSGFKFGSSTASTATTTATPASSFSFGSSPVVAKKDDAVVSAATTTPSFSFGSSSSSPVVAKKDTGSSSAVTTTASFTFGSSSSSPVVAKKENATGFAFGSSSSSPVAPKKDNSIGASTPTTGFSFGSNNKAPSSPSTPSRGKYVAHLKALNKQVSKWIKSHVDENPNVILTPIFKDYEKHLKEITEKYADSNKESNVVSSKPLLGAVFGGNKDKEPEKVVFNSSGDKNSGVAFAGFGKSPTEETTKAAEVASPASSFSFGAPSSNFAFGGSDSSKPPAASTFSFGNKNNGSTPTTTTAEASKGFSFGTTTTTAPATTGLFSFGTASSNSTASSGFSFGDSAKTGGSSSFFSGAAASATNNEQSDDVPYEPPKPEVVAVEEEDAIYSVRCKLYYKKEKDFVEKGLGMAHLKKVEEDKKIQLVVRADSSLGNILLNILINEKMMFTQRGNNVQFVAVPNPPIKGMDGPVTLLIKVKNASMAEELNGKIKEVVGSD